MCDRQDNSLNQLLDLFVQTTNVAVLFRGPLVDLHGLYSRIILCWERLQNQVRIFVDTHKVTGLEGLGINQANDRQEVSLSGGGLDDGTLALPLRVQVHVGSVFLTVFVRVYI